MLACAAMRTAALVIGSLGGVAGMVGALLSTLWIRASVISGALGGLLQGAFNQGPQPDVEALRRNVVVGDEYATVAFIAAVIATFGAGITMRYPAVGVVLMAGGLAGVTWAAAWFSVVAVPLLGLAIWFALVSAIAPWVTRSPTDAIPT